MMRNNRTFLLVAFPLLASLSAGCGRVSVTTFAASTKQVAEDRKLTAPHVAASGLHVNTPNGAIEIIADPALTEVMVAAHVTLYGETDEEAQANLPNIKVTTNRRPDQTLEIVADIPKEATGVRGSCSFVVRVPEARGCHVRSGSGSITLKGLAGPGDVHTANGSINVAGHTGDLTAQSGSGSITVKKVSAALDVKTANGSVTVSDAGGTVKAHSGSGSINITKAAGAVTAHTSNGSVSVDEAAGNVTADSGSGHVTLKNVKGAAKAKTANGPVTLEQVGGAVDAHSGSGSITCHLATDNSAAFHLATSNGSVTVRLPNSAAGSVRADTHNGQINVNGPRKPLAVSGDKGAKQIKLSEKGPESSAKTSSGSITVTLE